MACSRITKHTCPHPKRPQPIHHSTESSENPANQQPQIPKKSDKSRNSNSSVENKRIDKLPEFGAQFFFPRYVNPRIHKPPDFSPHALGPALMARDSCGAKAPPPPRAQPKSQPEVVPQDTEESEFVDAMDFGDVAFSVETVIPTKS